MKLLLDSCIRVLGRIRPEFIFVVLGLAFGVCLVFVTGPFQAPDESAHFRRAYHISDGYALGSRDGGRVGGLIPRGVIESIHDKTFYNIAQHPENQINSKDLCESLNRPFDAREKVFATFPESALYFPVCYIPQAIGITIGRWCGLSVLEIMYLGRVANLLCWTMMLYAAIRITPVFQWVFMLVALMPMSIFQAASLSADTPTNALAMLLTAIILRGSLLKEGNLGRLEMLTISVLCILLSLCKLAYFPITGLVLLIPVERFGGVKPKILFSGGIIGASIVTVIIWSLAVRGLYQPIYDANPNEQIYFLLARPWAFAEVFANTMVVKWDYYYFSFVGVLGWLDTFLPLWIYLTYPFVLIGLALLDKGHGRQLGPMNRLLIGTICIITFLLIELSLYIIWTKPGLWFVKGFQGRYLLPFYHTNAFTAL